MLWLIRMITKNWSALKSSLLLPVSNDINSKLKRAYYKKKKINLHLIAYIWRSRLPTKTFQCATALSVCLGFFRELFWFTGDCDLTDPTQQTIIYFPHCVFTQVKPCYVCCTLDFQKKKKKKNPPKIQLSSLSKKG